VIAKPIRLPAPRRRSLLRRLFNLLIILAAVPVLLTLAYRFVPPPVSALMLLRAVTGESIDYRWQPLANISAHLINAVTTAEDARICRHNGVDWDVLRGLVEDALDDETDPVRGGSTIAMQTAKNLFLWPHKSYIRKGLEIPLSLWIDFTWSKRRTVEVYLNIAEWGPGIFGAEAAAQHHFGRPASSLTRQQALQLAASLPNPHIFNPGTPGPKLRRRTARLSRRTPANPAYLECLKP
jgi:monofunctional biosynthetic peptidoglycan transglycosylase